MYRTACLAFTLLLACVPEQCFSYKAQVENVQSRQSPHGVLQTVAEENVRKFGRTAIHRVDCDEASGKTQCLITLRVQRSKMTKRLRDIYLKCLTENTGADVHAWGRLRSGRFERGREQSLSLLFNSRGVVRTASFVDRLANYITGTGNDGLESCLKHGIRAFQRKASPSINRVLRPGYSFAISEKFMLPIRLTRKATEYKLIGSPKATANGVTIVPLPDQPAETIQYVLGVLVESAPVTESLRLISTSCMIDFTGTTFSAWGMFNLGQLSPNILQMEFFVNLPASKATNNFSSNVVSYIGYSPVNETQNRTDSPLTKCVKARDSTFPRTGYLATGLTPTIRAGAIFQSNQEHLAPWIIAAILAGVAICTGIIAFFLLWTSAKKRHEPKEYKTEPSARDTRPEPTEDEEIDIMA